MGYSVLMSVYYKEKPEYFRQSLDSILSQTIVSDDIVLVCDGPLTTELDEVVKDFSEKHPGIFNVIRLPENKGLGDALNKGLSECRYELVARMDTDDISVPARMEEQLSVFADHPELSLLSGTVQEFENDDINNITCHKFLPLSYEKILKYSKKRCPFNHPAVMFKKSCVISAGGYRHFPFFEDYYLWMRMLKNGEKAMNLRSTLLYMRAGRDMYDRRGGIDYLKCVLRFRKHLWKHGYISFNSFLLPAAGQAVVCLMPRSLRIWFYRKALRRG